MDRPDATAATVPDPAAPALSTPPPPHLAAADALRREAGVRSARAREFLRGPDDPAARSVWRVNQVYWACAVYAGLFVLLRTEGVGGDPLGLWERTGLAVALVIGVTNLWLRSQSAVRRGGYGQGHPTRWGWWFTSLDLVTVSLGIRCSGGMDSGLLPLLFVVVVAETVLERSVEANLIRAGVAAAVLLGTLPLPLPDGPWLAGYLLNYATKLFFLLAVSIVTRRLRENADREKAEVAALRAELGLSEQRADLAREIHDGVGNALAASVLSLEVSARAMEKGRAGEAGTPDLLREEAQKLREALNSVRDWTFFNKPWAADAATDDALPPSARLRAEVERLSRRTEFAMPLEGAEAADGLPPATRLALFRIVQEALTNAAKYACPAGATAAAVTLRRDGRWLEFSVSDDGPGFEPATAGSGLGMASMRERAVGAGGSLAVETAPGAGVRVAGRLPAA
jgi:signal transduction histidine kinase